MSLKARTQYTIEYDSYYNTFYVTRYPSKNPITGYVTTDANAANKVVELMNNSQKR